MEYCKPNEYLIQNVSCDISLHGIDIKLDGHYRSETLRIRLPKSGTLRIEQGERVWGNTFINLYINNILMYENISIDLGNGFTATRAFITPMIKAGYRVSFDMPKERLIDNQFHVDNEIKFHYKPLEMVSKFVELSNKSYPNRSGEWPKKLIDFVYMDDDKLWVEFRGHEVSGSYVYASEVTPGYVEKLEILTGKKVKFLARNNGRRICDNYRFEISL